MHHRLENALRTPGSPATPAPQSETISWAAADPRRPRRVLIVDDIDDNRTVLSRRLTRAGYDTLVACDGPSALEAVLDERPDLVLLDWMMPGMTGLDVLVRLRQSWCVADLPVLIVTARDEPEAVAEALEAGANDFISKPIDFRVMRARIDGQLERVAAIRALAERNAALKGEVSTKAEESTRATAAYIRSSQDRRDAERQLAEAHVRAEAGERARAAFCSVARNGLEQDLAALERLAAALTVSPDSGRSAADMAFEVTQLLEGVTTAKLRLARMVADFDPEKVSSVSVDPQNLAEVLEDAVARAIELAGRRALPVSWRRDDFDVTVLADRPALSEAFTALIINAAEQVGRDATVHLMRDPTASGRFLVIGAREEVTQVLLDQALTQDGFVERRRSAEMRVAERLLKAHGGGLLIRPAGFFALAALVDLRRCLANAAAEPSR